MEVAEDDEDRPMHVNLYPDPENLPRYPWVGGRIVGEIDSLGDNLAPIRSVGLEPELSSQWRTRSAGFSYAEDHATRSEDPDFQYRDDDAM